MRIQLTLKVDDDKADAVVTALKEFAESEEGVTSTRICRIVPQKAIAV
jgi:hypothetical protein